MNQTQLNYFTRRMDAMVRDITSQMREALPMREELTRMEKIGLIAAGKARFREEQFNAGECSNYTYLLDSFEFPGVDEIKTFNSARSGQWNKIEDKIKKAAAKLVDAFVIEKIGPDEALAKLESTKFWKEV